LSGRNELPLNEVGAGQVDSLARYVATLGPIAAIRTSPLTRARQTAAAIGSTTGAPVTVDQDLVETDFGVWEGLTFAEAREGWPDEMSEWVTSDHVAPPKGESFSDVAVRALRALDTVRAAHPRQKVVMVTHVTPIKSLLRDALDAPLSALFRVHLDTASVSVIDYYDDGGPSVRLVNAADHGRW
jgi:probable phosphoglycerate mutase